MVLTQLRFYMKPKSSGAKNVMEMYFKLSQLELPPETTITVDEILVKDVRLVPEACLTELSESLFAPEVDVYFTSSESPHALRLDSYYEMIKWIAARRHIAAA